MTEPKILVVDDEPNILETVKYNLERSSFRVITASDGDEVIRRCRAELPDLVILDVMLPKMDGLAVCRALREEPKTRRIPILMLSVRAAEMDKVVGLELGADDYLGKPFSPRELVARVRALLRRSRDTGDGAHQVLEFGDLRIDWERHLVSMQKRKVELTTKEFALLRVLIQSKGRVLSREALLDRVWGYERSLEIETRTVDLHISQLRRKLKKEGDRIVTVKGVGYRFLDNE